MNYKVGSTNESALRVTDLVPRTSVVEKGILPTRGKNGHFESGELGMGLKLIEMMFEGW